MKTRLVVLALALVLLTGCTSRMGNWLHQPDGTWRYASDTWVYTWSRDDLSALQSDWMQCVGDISQHYTPKIAGDGPVRGYAKTCMEQRGYVKVGEDNVPVGQAPHWDTASQTTLRIRM